MAIYTIQIKTVSRSSGHSAIAKIAYNSRDKITDLRTGEIHKYSSKKMSNDLIHSEITYKDLEVNKKHRSEIWNNAELAENRKDSRTAREYVVALPKELSIENNIELVREFAQSLTKQYDNVADWAIHNEKDGNGNIHAHILTTTRTFNHETKKLGERTEIEWNNTKCKENNVPITQDQIKVIRKDWEVIQNKHLAMAGLNLSVSCEKKEDRSLVRKHLGKDIVALERKGEYTEFGDYNRNIDSLLASQTQIDLTSNKLIKERNDLEKLKQEKELFFWETEATKKAELETIENKKKLELEEIQKIKIPATNYITANTQYKLFDIAREHREFFTKQKTGEYEYWSNRDNSVVVHDTHINLFNPNEKAIKLGLDVAISKFGNDINIVGSDEFIKSTIDVLVNYPKYAEVSLNNPIHQEMLLYRKLELDIDKAPLLDLDDVPILNLDNVPCLKLDESKPEKKQDIEEIKPKVKKEISRGFSR